MPTFAGVDHFALSVTDLEVSQRFYSGVLGLLPVLDFGHGRVLMHTASGFTIGLVRHPDGGPSFAETNPGLDHIGLAAADREELVAWEAVLRAAGVPYSPIQDTDLGHHLNFRDPDGIPLEFHAPTETYAAVLAELRSRTVPDAEVLARAEGLLGAELVATPEDPDRSGPG